MSLNFDVKVDQIVSEGNVGYGTIYTGKYYHLDYISQVGWGDEKYNSVYLVIRENGKPYLLKDTSDRAKGFQSLQIPLENNVEQGIFNQFFSSTPQKSFEDRLREGIETQKQEIINNEQGRERLIEKARRMNKCMAKIDQTVANIVGQPPLKTQGLYEENK